MLYHLGNANGYEFFSIRNAKKKNPRLKTQIRRDFFTLIFEITEFTFDLRWKYKQDVNALRSAPLIIMATKASTNVLQLTKMKRQAFRLWNALRWIYKFVSEFLFNQNPFVLELQTGRQFFKAI